MTDEQILTPAEIEITPEMIVAGVDYLSEARAFVEPCPGSDEEVGRLAVGVFRAMLCKAPTLRF